MADRHILAEAISRPTLGAGQLLEFLENRGVVIPTTTPPPFGAVDTARVVPVNALAALTDAPRSYVAVGAAKTATESVGLKTPWA